MGRVDLTGQRFGRLIALSSAEKSARGRTRWHCQCDCGVKVVIPTFHLRGGNTLSCGCFREELRSTYKRTHGASRTRPYGIWSDMIKRCTNPNHKFWSRYGGRGIRICDAWLRYENFIADMGEPPPKYSIERKNNDGNYEPGNCIWVDQKTQRRNRSDSKFIVLRGKRMPVIEACERLGIPYRKVNSRACSSKISYPEAFYREIRRQWPMGASD